VPGGLAIELSAVPLEESVEAREPLANLGDVHFGFEKPEQTLPNYLWRPQRAPQQKPGVIVTVSFDHARLHSPSERRVNERLELEHLSELQQVQHETLVGQALQQRNSQSPNLHTPERTNA